MLGRAALLVKRMAMPRRKTYAVIPLMATIGGTGIGLLMNYGALNASEDAIPPPKYPWSHRFPWEALDHASIRRGHQVYKEVCATCHSLEHVAYRHLVDACFTEEEAKAIAAEAEYDDDPNEEGEVQKRPGRLIDYYPKPFKNEQEARFNNNGSLPPDLSLMIKARPGHADYVYKILTGYCDPPAGVQLREGANYNPYFPGGAIGMPPPLSNGAVTYEDGTEATIAQMAKDVTTFLCWTAEPEHDTRKNWGLKVFFVLALMTIPTIYYKRLKFAVLKTRQVLFK